MRDLAFAIATFTQNNASRDNRLVFWTQGFLIFLLTTLTLTSASIQDYLTGNLEALLGSDMVISQYQPLDAAHKAKLYENASVFSETIVLPISLTREGLWQRVQLKLVDQAYPVQGSLTKSSFVGGVAVPVGQGPEIGEIWVGSRVAASLGAIVGERVKIGDTELIVAAILQHEPDRLMEGHTVEMRALVNERSFINDPLPTGRMKYRYLIVADTAGRAVIRDWAKQAIPTAQLLDRHQGQHPLADYWKRVENFLGLASVLLFFMAAIAINMASRRQLEEQKSRLALYMSMGMPLGRGILLALITWFVAFMVALVLAVALAYGAQYVMMIELQSQFEGITAGVHLFSVVKTIFLVFVLLLATQIPSFLQLRKTSVVSLIRQQVQKGYGTTQLLWSGITLSILAVTYSDNWMLTAMILVSMIIALLLMMVVTWIALTVGEVWGRRRAGILPFAFFIMKQRLFNKSTQILGVGLCSTLLLFTLMLMKDLRDTMHSQLRNDNGNLIISDAQEGHMDALRDWSERTGSEIRHFSAYSRALAVRVNGKTLEDFATQPSESLARLARPIRLSWSDEVPMNNNVTGGNWWLADSDNWQQMSVEAEVMTDMALSFGDILTFDVAGKQYDFTIVASHAFKSGGSSITYWFQVPTKALSHMQMTIHHMGSIELPKSAWAELGGLLQQHPTLSVFSLQEITERFDKTLAMVTKGTVGFSAMILLLSLVVIVASVSGFEADDKKRNGLLLSMGFKKQDCLRLTFYEWLVTGLIAAVGAIAGTWIAGQLIYSEQFSMVYEPDYLWITTILFTTCLVVCSVGLFSCRVSLRATVRELMTE